MSKAILEFDLPEEKDEYELYFHSREMYESLYEISNLLRKIEKGYMDDAEEMYNEQLFEMIKGLIGESGIWDLN